MTSPRVVGLILAGGRSTRMGGSDKTFLPLAGRPLLEHVLERLRPQVDVLAISSNAPPALFAAYALPVLPDALGGSRGPLAGIHAGLLAYPDDLLLTVAVDLPFLPQNLVARLKAALRPGRCTYASDGRRHALAILWSPGQAGAIERALREDRASIRAWLETHGDPVVFDAPRDTDLSFNVNTPDDLERAQTLLETGDAPQPAGAARDIDPISGSGTPRATEHP
jgi:molybdopterin-guanine dinucleotide biosynthesis protein A